MGWLYIYLPLNRSNSTEISANYIDISGNLTDAFWNFEKILIYNNYINLYY